MPFFKHPKTGKPLTRLEKAQRLSALASAIAVMLLGIYHGKNNRPKSPQRKRVERNIKKSQEARKSSNFGEYLKKEKEVLKGKKGSGAKLTVETTTNSKIPTIHKPNTVIKRFDKNGKLISERIFDDKGRVIKDIHHTDHGNPKMHPKVPHEHIWDWSDPKKPRPSK